MLEASTICVPSVAYTTSNSYNLFQDNIIFQFWFVFYFLKNQTTRKINKCKRRHNQSMANLTFARRSVLPYQDTLSKLILIVLYTVAPQCLKTIQESSISSQIENSFVCGTTLLVRNQKNTYLYLAIKYSFQFRFVYSKLRTHDYLSYHPSAM